MAKASFNLIAALRETAHRLKSGGDYHWAHVGKCNCGHLAQTVTGLSASAIFQRAREHRLEEWTEYAHDYCPMNGYPMSDVMDALLAIGLEHRDIHHLEYLSDMRVLTRLPGGMRYLRRNQPDDVALYIETWADLLEEQMINQSDEAAKLIAFPEQATQSDISATQ